MTPLLLASASERRRELILSLGIPFHAVSPDLDETIFDHLSVPDRVDALARAKSRAGAASVRTGQTCPYEWVLGADTLVWMPGTGEVLGKPLSATDAHRMLLVLSGRTHTVSTALSLMEIQSGRFISAYSESTVTFAPLDDDELARYIESRDWEDAAGGYKIQGLASLFIERIEGSWSGIVGLPLRELYGILREAGYRPLYGIRRRQHGDRGTPAPQGQPEPA